MRFNKDFFLSILFFLSSVLSILLLLDIAAIFFVLFSAENSSFYNSIKLFLISLFLALSWLPVKFFGLAKEAYKDYKINLA